VSIVAPIVVLASRDAGAVLAILGVLGFLAIATLVVTPVLGATGAILCFWVPKKSGAHVLIIVSFGLFAGCLVLFLIALVMAASAPCSPGGGALAAAGTALVFNLLGLLAMIGGAVLFMLFLRQLAYYLRDRASGDEALSLMITWLVAGIAGPLLLFPLS